MAFAMFVGGYILSRWDRRGDKQETLGLDATALGTRLKAAEDWIARHSNIMADFSGLESKLDSMSKALERIEEWIDGGRPTRAARRSN